MTVNKGLGRGLSALFSDTDAEYDSSFQKEEKEPLKEKGDLLKESMEISLDKIFPNPDQPRKNFESGALTELANSISEHGILSPLLLCEKQGKYMIIAGERRYRAALIAGLKTVPAIVKEYSDKKIKEISLIENLQREDLNPVEVAVGLKQLMDEYNLTQDEVSKRIGKSRSAIANLLRLLTLSPAILDMIKDKRISEGHARCLVGLENERAFLLAQTIFEKGLSVREAEKVSKQRYKSSFGGGKKEPVHRQSRELKDLIEDMQRVFGTKVSAVGTDDKGRIYIDYFNTDDLDRIFCIIDKIKRQ